MNIYKVTRTYYQDTRTTWHDSKMSADRIVKRHKRLGKEFMRKLDKLSVKYSPKKREADVVICEDYLMERDNILRHFSEEHGEKDAPMKWVKIEKITVKPLRSSLVAFVKREVDEWEQM